MDTQNNDDERTSLQSGIPFEAADVGKKEARTIRNANHKYAAVRVGKCFICLRKSDVLLSPRAGICLTHYIRGRLRKRGILFKRGVYPARHSRVRHERRVKGVFIVAAIRAHYIAVREGHIQPIRTARAALRFIDELWDSLALHHSFLLRTIKLVEFVQFLIFLDHEAAHPRKKEWRGDKKNIHKWRSAEGEDAGD